MDRRRAEGRLAELWCRTARACLVCVLVPEEAAPRPRIQSLGIISPSPSLAPLHPARCIPLAAMESRCAARATGVVGVVVHGISVHGRQQPTLTFPLPFTRPSFPPRIHLPSHPRSPFQVMNRILAAAARPVLSGGCGRGGGVSQDGPQLGLHPPSPPPTSCSQESGKGGGVCSLLLAMREGGGESDIPCALGCYANSTVPPPPPGHGTQAGPLGCPPWPNARSQGHGGLPPHRRPPPPR